MKPLGGKNHLVQNPRCVFLMSRVLKCYPHIKIQEKGFNPNQSSFGCVLYHLLVQTAGLRHLPVAAGMYHMVTEWPIIGVTRFFVTLRYLSPSIPT